MISIHDESHRLLTQLERTNPTNFKKKKSRRIGVLRKIRYFVDTKTLIQLYHTIILPFYLVNTHA